MIPSRTIFDAIASLLAADTATLAGVSAMNVHLAKSPFVPALDLDISTLTEATFTGSTAISAGTGTQQFDYDAATGLLTITILEPAGGWHWKCTAAPTPAETIYGYYLTDNAGTTLYAAALLPAPLTISKANQGLDIPFLQFRFLNNSPN